jgi:plastocyanin
MTFSRPVAIAASALALVGLLAIASGALAAGTQQAVSIVDKTFTPKELTVQVGDTVVWTVTKSIGEPHTVTSGTSGGADIGKVFDSKLTLKDNGTTFSFTFATAGSFAYFCQVHPAEMTGTITVLAPGQSAPPAASAEPAASETPGGGAEHPPVSTSDKLAAAGILVAVIVLLFGSAWYYRRINRPG